jgi:hypothetical protein
MLDHNGSFFFDYTESAFRILENKTEDECVEAIQSVYDLQRPTLEKFNFFYQLKAGDLEVDKLSPENRSLKSYIETTYPLYFYKWIKNHLGSEYSSSNRFDFSVEYRSRHLYLGVKRPKDYARPYIRISRK